MELQNEVRQLQQEIRTLEGLWAKSSGSIQKIHYRKNRRKKRGESKQKAGLLHKVLETGNETYSETARYQQGTRNKESAMAFREQANGNISPQIKQEMKCWSQTFKINTMEDYLAYFVNKVNEAIIFH